MASATPNLRWPSHCPATRCQFILLGDRGTCVWTTCLRLLPDSGTTRSRTLDDASLPRGRTSYTEATLSVSRDWHCWRYGNLSVEGESQNRRAGRVQVEISWRPAWCVPSTSRWRQPADERRAVNNWCIIQRVGIRRVDDYHVMRQLNVFAAPLLMLSSCQHRLFNYFNPGSGAKYCDEQVCLSVCLSSRVTRKRHGRTSRPNFLCMLPVAMARFSSDGDAIRYVLPVLWMTPCFHTVGPMGQNQVRRYL